MGILPMSEFQDCLFFYGYLPSFLWSARLFALEQKESFAQILLSSNDFFFYPPGYPKSKAVSALPSAGGSF